MATVYSVWEGTNGQGERETRASFITVEDAVALFQGHRLVHQVHPPTFGGATPSDLTRPPRHLVVEIGDTETGGLFPRPGYYFSAELTPADAERILGRALSAGH
jgi:hypothetical protein